MQPEISKKKGNAMDKKKPKEKVLVSRKLQENQTKNVLKEIKNKQTKTKTKNKWKSKKNCGWGGGAKRKVKKCKINENQRKGISKEEVE